VAKRIFRPRNEDFRSECPKLHSRAIKQTFRFRPKYAAPLGAGLRRPWSNSLPASRRLFQDSACTRTQARPACGQVQATIAFGRSLRTKRCKKALIVSEVTFASNAGEGKRVASSAWTQPKYSSRVQFAAAPRRPVCQVCIWALMKPGMTIRPVPSISSASVVTMSEPIAAMRPFSTRTSPDGSRPSSHPW
jgi:hypothetical protein